MRIHPQIIIKKKQPEFVVLPYSEYLLILETLEDQIDLKAIEEFHSTNQEAFPLEIVQKISHGESPIKVFRELRRISQSDLAKKVGISRQYLNQIENKVRTGRAEILKKIAILLNIETDLLID